MGRYWATTKGSKGVAAQAVDGVNGVRLQLGVLAVRKIDHDLLNEFGIGVLERTDLPESGRSRAVAVVSRIKDRVKPILRVLKLLVLAQLNGDQQRRMEEKFPVVNRVGPTG